MTINKVGWKPCCKKFVSPISKSNSPKFANSMYSYIKHSLKFQGYADDVIFNDADVHTSVLMGKAADLFVIYALYLFNDSKIIPTRNFFI